MKRLVPTVLAAALLAGCGGGGGASPANSGATAVNNVQPIEVDLGLDGDYVNGVFTSVTVCVAGTSTCQTVPNVLVDTGSEGLRIAASALTIAPARIRDTQGNNVGECLTFEDAYTWGPVATADVELAGEKASGVNLQVVGDTTFAGVPSACSNSGLPAQDTVSALGANGILGVGVFPNDCGPSCSTVTGAAPPPVYFDCPSSSCSATTIPTSDQVQNPVTLFASDNNGVEVVLPAIPATGEATLNGSLIFGIGTQSNNGLGSVTVMTTDDNGEISSTYKSTPYSAVVDSGSNAYFLLDAGTLGIPDCGDPNSGFYCPANTATFSLTQRGVNGAQQTDTINIANADTLFNTNNAAFNDLGGPSPDFVDLGLSFFFGRTVYFAFYGSTTAAGAGPWVAF